MDATAARMFSSGGMNSIDTVGSGGVRIVGVRVAGVAGAGAVKLDEHGEALQALLVLALEVGGTSDVCVGNCAGLAVLIEFSMSSGVLRIVSMSVNSCRQRCPSSVAWRTVHATGTVDGNWMTFRIDKVARSYQSNQTVPGSDTS